MEKKRAFLDECVGREELARLFDRNGHIYGHYPRHRKAASVSFPHKNSPPSI